MKVLILGAGLGTRLRPITDFIPKVMVPIGGKPLLEHTICLLRDQGFNDFIINLHYRPEVITSHFGDGSRFGVSIAYSDEADVLLETGGALKKAAKYLSDDFILIYGDHLHQFDFRPIVALHKAYKGLATIVLKRSDHPQNGEVGEIDPETHLIKQWHVRPHAIQDYGKDMYVNSGLYVLSKKVLEFIPQGKAVKFDKEIVPQLVAQSAAYGFPTDEDILDIGTPEKYAFAEEWYKKRRGMA